MAVAIGNFSNEMTAFYVTRAGRTQFVDEAISTGLGPNTRLQLTFGLFYFDYDLDTRLDLLCATGIWRKTSIACNPVSITSNRRSCSGMRVPSTERSSCRSPREHCGEDLLKPMVGRGAGFADIDNDGDLDVLITSSRAKTKIASK